MDCKEIIEEIVSIEAYKDSDISFSYPSVLMPRTISSSDYSVTPGKGMLVFFDEDDPPLLKEKYSDTRGGGYRTVNISWSSSNTDKKNIAQQEELAKDFHHFIFTCLDGRKIMLRTDEFIYKFTTSFNGKTMESSLSFSSETGLQFIEPNPEEPNIPIIPQKPSLLNEKGLPILLEN